MPGAHTTCTTSLSASTPGVIVMDEQQYRCGLLDEAMNPAVDNASRPYFMLAIFTRLSPMDAAVHWSWEDGKLTCTLCRAKGDTARVFAYSETADLPKVLGGVTDWLCAELGIKQASSPSATWLAQSRRAPRGWRRHIFSATTG